jgi:hypothetical protein
LKYLSPVSFVERPFPEAALKLAAKGRAAFRHAALAMPNPLPAVYALILTTLPRSPVAKAAHCSMSRLRRSNKSDVA